MNLTRSRRFVPLALAALLAGTAAAPATADSIKAPPVVLAADVINSPLGFVGCIPIDGWDYCFAAQRIVDGPLAGSVSVTSRVTPNPHKGFLSLPQPRLDPPDVVYEQVVGPTSLVLGSDPQDRYITLQADLDGIGRVDLNMGGSGGEIWQVTPCPDEGVRGEVVAPSSGAGYVWWVHGSIGGRAYRGGGCLPFFWVGPAVGAWSMDALG